MLLPRTALAPGRVMLFDWIRAGRARLDHPALRVFRAVVGTLVLLVVIGVATGQLLGHLLASGIESLLTVIAHDQTG